MKPIAVFQHTEVGQPGTIVPILESLGRSVQRIAIVDGAEVPVDASGFAGLVFLGGYMGVHDDIPWIASELSLIRDAAARGVPVAGHCLGSQLVAEALGGSVARNAVPEIGWRTITAEAGTFAAEWWGEYAGADVPTFQWHADTFTPPDGARRIGYGKYCENQAFVFGGMHLMLQSHLEMTPDLVRLSVARNGHQLRKQYELGNPAVSDPTSVERDLERRTEGMKRVLERLYARWVRACS